MNITTLNMTTLDGVVIKKGEGGGGATINNQDKVVDITENGTTEVVADGGYTGLGKVTINTEVSGGGADLEGEYFLAKPNGRYKKITFINGYVDPSSLSEDQQIVMSIITAVQSMGGCYSGFVCTAGAGNGLNKQNFVEEPIFLASKTGKGYFLWESITSIDNIDDYIYDINDGTCFAWEEMDISIEGLTLPFIEIMQLLLIDILGYEPSVEEVYEFLQIEDVDKAVYDEWKNR